MYLDIIRESDREQVLLLQKQAGCEFPIPEPLTGFVVRDSQTRMVVGWASWEPVAEILGIVDTNLSVREKIRIWSSLHKPIESQIIQKGIVVAYVQVKKEQSKFAAILNMLGWMFCPGYWLRREAGMTLNSSRHANNEKSVL